MTGYSSISSKAVTGSREAAAEPEEFYFSKYEED